MTGASCVKLVCALESRDLLGDRRLAVRSLVLVQNALAHGLVDDLACIAQGGLGNSLVAAGDRGAGRTDGRPDLALDRLIAILSLLVGADALDLRLDICHVQYVLA